MKCASPNSPGPALAAHAARDLAVKIELQHAAGMPMPEPQRAAAVSSRPQGVPGTFEFALKDTVRVEHLDALIVAVGGVNDPFAIDHDRMRDVEFAGPRPFLPQVLM
jgi:hypothetical protein